MKPPIVSDRCSVVVLWIAFLAIAGIFAFGAAVEVEFTDPSVPLSQAWNSTDWRRSWHMFGDREYIPISIIAVQVMLLCTFHRSPVVRLGALVLGFLVPAFSISVEMLGMAFISPLLILDVPRGKASGEFYEEGLPMIGACGLWMLLCLGFAVRQAWLLRHPRATAGVLMNE